MGASLEGYEKIWGYRGCRYKATVGVGLWGFAVIAVILASVVRPLWRV
jgi:hypothetical protein